jgi:hypothetical protein
MTAHPDTAGLADNFYDTPWLAGSALAHTFCMTAPKTKNHAGRSRVPQNGGWLAEFAGNSARKPATRHIGAAADEAPANTK